MPLLCGPLVPIYINIGPFVFKIRAHKFGDRRTNGRTIQDIVGSASNTYQSPAVSTIGLAISYQHSQLSNGLGPKG